MNHEYTEKQFQCLNTIKLKKKNRKSKLMENLELQEYAHITISLQEIKTKYFSLLLLLFKTYRAIANNY